MGAENVRVALRLRFTFSFYFAGEFYFATLLLLPP